jgi:hypothetical protein
MKKLIAICFSVLLLVAACNKDQKVVRQLDGSWKVSSMTYDGAPVPSEEFSNLTYEFEKCKLSEGDCNGKMIGIDPTKGEYTFPFTYKISDDGLKLHMTFSMFGQTSITHGDIIESSKSKFQFSTTDEDGKKTVTTLEKK